MQGCLKDHNTELSQSNYSILFIEHCVVLLGETTWGQVDFTSALHGSESKRNYAHCSCYKGSQDFSQNILAPLPLLLHSFPLRLHCTYTAKSIWKWKEVNSPRIHGIVLPLAILTSFPMSYISISFENLSWL